MKFSGNNTIVLSIIEAFNKVEMSVIFNRKTKQFYTDIVMVLNPDKDGEEDWDNIEFLEALIDILTLYPWRNYPKEFEILGNSEQEQELKRFFVENNIKSPQDRHEYCIAILECYKEIKQLLG